MSLELCLSFFLLLLLLVDTSNNFLLKTVTALTPTHLHCPFLFSPRSLKIHPTVYKVRDGTELRWEWMHPTGCNNKLFCTEQNGVMWNASRSKGRREKESERSVVCLTFSNSRKSFDSDFRIEKFYCAWQKVWLAVTQHSQAYGSQIEFTWASVTCVSPLHQNIKKAYWLG